MVKSRCSRLIGIIGIYASSVALFCLITGTFPAFHNLDRWYMVLPMFFLILVLGGPLGEEIGWRGFLLPWLLQRFRPLAASVLLGFVWSFWHLPLFYMPGSAQYGAAIPGFTLFFVAASILFTWLYVNTSGSALLAILFHTSINTVSFCMQYVMPAIDQAKLHSYLFLIVTCVLAATIAILAMTRTRRFNGPRDPFQFVESAFRQS